MKNKYFLKITGCIAAFISLSFFSYSQWLQKNDFGGTSRWGAVSFSIGTKAYVGLGNDGNNRNDFWAYDQVTGMWSAIAPFPGAGRYQAVAFSIGNKGYVGTGASGLAFPYTPLYNDFYEYDPSNNQWTPLAPFPGTARFGAVGFSIGNKGYIGTGFDAVNYFRDDFYEYDTTNNQWTAIAAFTGGNRMEAVAFSIGNKGYVGTGGNYMTTIDVFNDFWQYDPDNNQWNQKAAFGGVARSLGVAFTVNGKGYIGLGGNFNNLAYGDFWQYDTTNNHWSSQGNFAGTYRWLSTGFSIGNKGYISTGGTFAPTFGDLWEFNPATAGIENPDRKNQLTIYPNPAADYITINAADKIIGVEVYSSEGEIVVDKTDANSDMISIRNIPEGIYTAKITVANTQIYYKKIVIMH
jgi:N-acetylneuraminic acid mutarotase